MDVDIDTGPSAEAGHLYLAVLKGEAYFRAPDDDSAVQRAFGGGEFDGEEISSVETLIHSTNCECGAGDGEEVG